MGGSMVVHVFGAYYGLAASYFLQPGRATNSKNMRTSHPSQLVACIGTIFLWMFWPSFNGALASGAQQHRVIVNTVLAIVGSVMCAASIARFYFGRLNMEIMLNATLAGGVAIGTNADLVTSPGVALLIGGLGGILSAVGFVKIGPYLLEKIGLHDTCGVNSLHGMPGILAALISMVVIPTMKRNFPDDYLEITAAGGTYGH